MRTPPLRHLTLALTSSAVGLLVAAGTVLAGSGGGATVTRQPIVSEDCHPDTDPVTGETFETCQVVTGQTTVVETPGGNSVLITRSTTHITVTSDRTGLVSTTTTRAHQSVLVSDDPDFPEVNHTDSHTVTVTAAETCTRTVVSQFVQGEEVARNSSQHCRPTD